MKNSKKTKNPHPTPLDGKKLTPAKVKALFAALHGLERHLVTLTFERCEDFEGRWVRTTLEGRRSARQRPRYQLQAWGPTKTASTQNIGQIVLALTALRVVEIAKVLGIPTHE